MQGQQRFADISLRLLVQFLRPRERGAKKALSLGVYPIPWTKLRQVPRALALHSPQVRPLCPRIRVDELHPLHDEFQEARLRIPSKQS